jgi:single-stranded DNA-binding protein
MAEITIKGYVNKPSSRKAGSKNISVFTLASKQKNYNADDTKNYFNCTDWKNSSPPAENSFVTVTGFLTFRKYTKDGQEREAKEINVQTIQVAESRNGTTAATPKTQPTEAADDFADDSDIPF